MKIKYIIFCIMLVAIYSVCSVNLRDFYKQWNVRTSAAMHAIRTFFKPSLSYCPCLSLQERKVIAGKIAEDIAKRLPDKNKELVYTSFCSGMLKQDLFIIEQLIKKGYTYFHVNLIDFMYDPKVAASPYNQFAVLREELIRSLSSHKTALLSMNVYKSADEYAQNVGKNDIERSDILIMIDPAKVYYYLKKAIGEFNYLKEHTRTSTESPVYALYHKGSGWIAEPQELIPSRKSSFW